MERVSSYVLIDVAANSMEFRNRLGIRLFSEMPEPRIIVTAIGVDAALGDYRNRPISARPSISPKRATVDLRTRMACPPMAG